VEFLTEEDALKAKRGLLNQMSTNLAGENLGIEGVLRFDSKLVDCRFFSEKEFYELKF